MLWMKALHIVLVASWFAGLFYLPRIFVNLAMVPADSTAERDRLLLMADKLLALGKVLKEMHEARLQWQFPDRPCTVTLSIPEDAHDLGGYQLTFWQNDLSVTE